MTCSRSSRPGYCRRCWTINRTAWSTALSLRGQGHHGSRAGHRSSASSVGSVRSSRSANHQLRVHDTQQRQEQLQEEQAKLRVLERHQARPTASTTSISAAQKRRVVMERHQQDMQRYASASRDKITQPLPHGWLAEGETAVDRESKQQVIIRQVNWGYNGAAHTATVSSTTAEYTVRTSQLRKPPASTTVHQVAARGQPRTDGGDGDRPRRPTTGTPQLLGLHERTVGGGNQPDTSTTEPGQAGTSNPKRSRACEFSSDGEFGLTGTSVEFREHHTGPWATGLVHEVFFDEEDSTWYVCIDSDADFGYDALTTVPADNVRTIERPRKFLTDRRGSADSPDHMRTLPTDLQHLTLNPRSSASAPSYMTIAEELPRSHQPSTSQTNTLAGRIAELEQQLLEQQAIDRPLHPPSATSTPQGAATPRRAWQDTEQRTGELELLVNDTLPHERVDWTQRETTTRHMHAVAQQRISRQQEDTQQRHLEDNQHRQDAQQHAPQPHLQRAPQPPAARHFKVDHHQDQPRQPGTPAAGGAEAHYPNVGAHEQYRSSPAGLLTHGQGGALQLPPRPLPTMQIAQEQKEHLGGSPHWHEAMPMQLPRPPPPPAYNPPSSHTNHHNTSAASGWTGGGMETQYKKMPYVHTRLKEKFCYRKMTVAAFIYKMNMENSKDNHGRIAPAEMLVMDMIRSCEETLETQLFLAGANTDTPSEFEARLHRNCPKHLIKDADEQRYEFARQRCKSLANLTMHMAMMVQLNLAIAHRVPGEPMPMTVVQYAAYGDWLATISPPDAILRAASVTTLVRHIVFAIKKTMPADALTWLVIMEQVSPLFANVQTPQQLEQLQSTLTDMADAAVLKGSNVAEPPVHKMLFTPGLEEDDQHEAEEPDTAHDVLVKQLLATHAAEQAGNQARDEKRQQRSEANKDLRAKITEAISAGLPPSLHNGTVCGHCVDLAKTTGCDCADWDHYQVRCPHKLSDEAFRTTTCTVCTEAGRKRTWGHVAGSIRCPSNHALRRKAVAGEK